MRVIGVGVGRTGTLSVKAALEQLGLGPCFHGRHVLDHPDRLALWNAAAAGSAVDWQAVFEGYASSVDWPGAAFWRQLATVFPDAKLVLTVRDPDAWYESVRRTIFQLFGGGNDHALVGPAWEGIPGLRVMHGFHRRIVWDGFFQGRFEDRDFAIKAYEDHNAAVRREIPPERLLVFDVRDGWSPLCEFLEVPTPEGEFPRLNDPTAFWGRVQARLDESR